MGSVGDNALVAACSPAASAAGVVEALELAAEEDVEEVELKRAANENVAGNGVVKRQELFLPKDCPTPPILTGIVELR